MAKLSSLTLDELYSKEKITKAVEIAIVSKSDFTTINERYCEKVCRLKCKNPGAVRLNQKEVDVVIIQDHHNPPGKFDRNPRQQDEIQSRVIDFIAKRFGLGTLSYKVLSLLKCNPDPRDFPSGKPPAETTLQKCFPYLHQELITSKPKAIISLSTAVTKALGLSKKSNTGNRGEIAISPYGPVVITLHSRILTYIRQNARGAGGMWGPDYLNVIGRDFEKAFKIARGELKVSTDTLSKTVEEIKKNRLLVAESLKGVQHIVDTINSLPETSVISFDTETTSLDPLDPTLRILTIQFGWRDVKTGKIVAGVIPLNHRKNTFYDPDEAWKLVEPVLKNEKRIKVGHNAKYDILVIYHAKGVRVAGVRFDTLLLLHSIESGTQGCYGLKTACWDHLYESGYAGYEDDLGDLKALTKLRAKELESQTEEELDDVAIS